MADIYRHFYDCARRYASKDAIRYFENEELRAWSYAELLRRVDALAEGLHGLGLKPGDRFGLIAANGPYWPLINFALAREGIVLVPVHTTLSVAQVKTIFAQSKVRGVFLGPGAEHFIAAVPEILPASVEVALYLDKIPLSNSQGSPKSLRLDDAISLGEQKLKNQGPRPLPEIKESDLSTIMYTSGTTGEMKGVLLTHGNLTHNAIEGERVVGGKKEGHVLLSILPLSHAFERVAGLLGPLFMGCTVAYGRGLNSVSDDLKEIHPNQLNVVPRLMEKMHEGIQNTVKKKGPLIERIFVSTTLASENYVRNRQRGSAKAWLYWLGHQMGELLFYQKVRQQLGGNIDRFISGGAALDPKIWCFFTAAGFKVLEGYGLTECSPIVSVPPGDRPKIGSVGKALPGVEIKIGENEEILVRGPNVMIGYENNPEATQEAIDAEGWFHSGDQGYLDAEGYLFIKGRVKELIVTSYGKNIIPTAVERVLESSPMIFQSAVFGHNRAYLAGLIVPHPDEAKKWAQRQGLDQLSWHELCQHPRFREEIERQIEIHSQDLAHYERLKKFTVIEEEFNQERDFLTPTLKLKRKKIAEYYQKQIEAMY